MKFFSDNYIDDSSTFTLTSANSNLTSYLYDNDYDTQLLSVGSDDLTDEVFEIEFDASKDIDRIFIANHNIKAGEVEYWTGAAWASFSTPASLSNNTESYNYFEFNSVSTTKIRFTMNTTQTADAEKAVGQLRAMEEIGEVETDPVEAQITFKKKQRLNETGTGGNVQVVFGEKYRATFNFNDASTTDLALFQTLNNDEESFFIYPSGGDSTITNYGFRLQDMYLVNYVNDFRPNLKGNLYNIGTEIEITVHEV